MRNQKGIIILIILGIIALFVIGTGIVYFFMIKPTKETSLLTQNQVYQQYKQAQQITTDETTDWKTYRNEEDGYEIEYPSNWRVAECGINCKGFGPRNISEDIIMSINIYFLPIKVLKDTGLLPVLSNSTNKLIKEEPIIINEQKWIKLTIKQEKSDEIFIHHITERQNKTFDVGLGIDDSDMVKDYNKILSTFKFIE